MSYMIPDDKIILRKISVLALFDLPSWKIERGNVQFPAAQAPGATEKGSQSVGKKDIVRVRMYQKRRQVLGHNNQENRSKPVS